MTTSERLATSGQTGEMARGQATIETPQGQAAERTLNDSIRHMIESVRPEAIFGNPVEREGAAVIPCAEVTTGFGMGGGSGFGPASAPGSRQAESGAAPANITSSGGGIGGGGGAQGRPVAVVVISQGHARVLPVVDVTKLMIAALTTLGFVAFWLSQTMARTQTRGRQAFSAARFARSMRSARGRAF